MSNKANACIIMPGTILPASCNRKRDAPASTAIAATAAAPAVAPARAPAARATAAAPAERAGKSGKKDEEAAYPRGGAQPLTPQERRQVEAAARAAVEDEELEGPVKKKSRRVCG